MSENFTHTVNYEQRRVFVNSIPNMASFQATLTSSISQPTRAYVFIKLNDRNTLSTYDSRCFDTLSNNISSIQLFLNGVRVQDPIYNLITGNPDLVVPYYDLLASHNDLYNDAVLGQGNNRGIDLSLNSWRNRYPFLYFDLTNLTGVSTNVAGGTNEISVDVQFTANPGPPITLYTVIYYKQSALVSLSNDTSKSIVNVSYPL